MGSVGAAGGVSDGGEVAVGAIWLVKVDITCELEVGAEVVSDFAELGGGADEEGVAVNTRATAEAMASGGAVGVAARALTF